MVFVKHRTRMQAYYRVPIGNWIQRSWRATSTPGQRWSSSTTPTILLARWVHIENASYAWSILSTRSVQCCALFMDYQYSELANSFSKNFGFSQNINLFIEPPLLDTERKLWSYMFIFVILQLQCPKFYNFNLFNNIVYLCVLSFCCTFAKWVNFMWANSVIMSSFNI